VLRSEEIPPPVERRAVVVLNPLRVRVVPVRDDVVRPRPEPDVLRLVVFASLRPAVLLPPVCEPDVLFLPLERVVPFVRDAAVVRRALVFFAPPVRFVRLPVRAVFPELRADSVLSASVLISFSMILLPSP